MISSFITMGINGLCFHRSVEIVRIYILIDVMQY